MRAISSVGIRQQWHSESSKIPVQTPHAGFRGNKGEVPGLGGENSDEGHLFHLGKRARTPGLANQTLYRRDAEETGIPKPGFRDQIEERVTRGAVDKGRGRGPVRVLRAFGDDWRNGAVASARRTYLSSARLRSFRWGGKVFTSSISR